MTLLKECKKGFTSPADKDNVSTIWLIYTREGFIPSRLVLDEPQLDLIINSQQK